MLRPIWLGSLLLSTLAAQDAAPPSPWQGRLERSSATPAAWTARRAEIRRQILLAAGLYPEFDRPPLKPDVFGKVEGEGYTIERVVLETLPGFYLSGSLYRPRGKDGPFPGILSPHGHWKEGRFTQEKVGNLPARGISFARLGFVCFMYDMVGYGDFKQMPHHFADPAWGQGLFGLQTWNSLRALDFLSSLPDVDARRIGCTGASGGGTQTFILSAIDDRIACSAPVNMVAAEFQGGCTCENAPFLRIGLNNVEIAAATAPRPLLLIAATGDWTHNVPVLEAPAVQKVYERLGVAERFRAVQFNAPHNYNQDSRETVYAWMARWLDHRPDEPRLAEPPVPAVAREDLAVWTGDHPVPPGSVDAEALRKLLRERVLAQLGSLRPRDAASLRRYRELMEPAWRLTLTVQPSPGGSDAESAERVTVVVARRPEDAAPFQVSGPAQGRLGHARVLLIGPPHAAEPATGGDAQQRKTFPTTFYRTELAREVQDILDTLDAVGRFGRASSIRLVGLGDAGLAVVLARAVSPARVGLTIADLSGAAASLEAAPHPGFDRLGGWPGAAMLAPPGILVLHGLKEDAEPIRAAYRAAGRESALVLDKDAWTRERIVAELAH